MEEKQDMDDFLNQSNEKRNSQNSGQLSDRKSQLLSSNTKARPNRASNRLQTAGKKVLNSARLGQPEEAKGPKYEVRLEFTKMDVRVDRTSLFKV